MEQYPESNFFTEASQLEDLNKYDFIDQRLVSPNTENDSKYGLQRMQTYGHGKSFTYLKALRLKMGLKKFDMWVNSYLMKKDKANYDNFLDKAPELYRQEISKTEELFTIR